MVIFLCFFNNSNFVSALKFYIFAKKRNIMKIIKSNKGGSRLPNCRVIKIESPKTQKELFEEYLQNVVNSIKCCINDFNYTPTYKDWLTVQKGKQTPFVLTEENFNACVMVAILKYGKEIEEFYNKNAHKFSHPSINILK